MKRTKKILAMVLVLALTLSLLPANSISAVTKKVELNKNKVIVYVGKTVTLKLKNNKKKVKWSSSNNKVATVSKKGKVKGKKAGKVTITARVGKKKYNCKITVKKKKTNNKLKWSINSNGTLYWSGGNVNKDGFSQTNLIPWYSVRNKIKKVVVGKGVDYISGYTFWKCKNLESISIPAGVKSISEDAFYESYKLKSINVTSENPNYTSADGVLFNKDKTKIIKYPNGKEGKYEIPNTVKTIMTSAFRECGKLTELKIPDSVTTIDVFAFHDCTSLLKVTVPKTVTKMDEYCGLGFKFSKAGEDMISGFVMEGYAGTAAEDYAKKKGFTFIEIKE